MAAWISEVNVADAACIRSFAVSPEVLLSDDRLVHQSLIVLNRPKLAVTRGGSVMLTIMLID